MLETERMLLRRFTTADAGPLAALYGDPRVMRFVTLQPPSLAEVESKILPEYLREYQELADGLGAEHGDFVYELTRSDWTRQVNDKPAEHGQS